MSRKFNPLSAAVAVTTASVILGVAGCAMNTRTTDETAGLSRESEQNSQAVAQADTSSTMPSTTTVETTPMPSAQWTEPAPSPTTVANDTAVIPPADQSTPIATAPAYPSSTETTTTTTTTTASPPASVDTSTTTASSEQPLPPRSDRN